MLSADLVPLFQRSVLGRLVSSVEVRFNFFVEGESECTSESALGQFSIFGAVEEMFAADFRGSARSRISPVKWLQAALRAAFGLRESVRRKDWRRPRLIVHRGCTGNAERQGSGVRGSFRLASLRRDRRGGRRHMSAVGIRCMGFEEFSSGVWCRRELPDGKSEWGQLLG